MTIQFLCRESLRFPLIGVSDIDAHHEKMFEMISCSYNGLDGEGMAKFLKEFQELWGAHTALEIEFMRTVGYPFVDQHLVHHSLIANYVASSRILLTDAKRSGDCELILHPLVTMLMDHIHIYDRQLVGFNSVNLGVISKAYPLTGEEK